MCDWPKSDCDVSVTDRQTETHFGFWAITFERPSHQGARGFARARPGGREINALHNSAIRGFAIKIL